MKAQIIKGKYNSDKTISLFVRDENLEKKTIRVSGFEPYFYVSANAYIPNHPRLKRIEKTKRDIDRRNSRYSSFGSV